VLAGAAAVDPAIGPVPLILALVLFLWTPPHFWSLAMAFRKDYEAARVPMLPVVVGDARCAKAIFAHTLALVTLSLVPAWLGLGPLYLVAALAGGGWFVWTSWQLVQQPGAKAAMTNFHASLAQLSLLLLAAIVDGAML
jgi:protoheme IX farnesyltransferase